MTNPVCDTTTPRKTRARKAAPTTAVAVKQEENPSHKQLEFWPHAVRGVPNTALRGSLFSITQRRATANKRELLACVDGVEIRFKGERFNQTDLDVWEMLLHLGRQQPLGDRVEFCANAFLRELDRGVGKAQHEQLKEEITRLRAGTVEIRLVEKGKVFGGGLVSKYFYDETQQRYVVIFDEDMLKLYDAGYTHVDWEQRKKLGNNNLAKWLHGFYSTHASPYDYKVETIRDLCGSNPSQRLGDFRKLLRAALKKLKDQKSILDWKIDPKTDLLSVWRKPSVSQQRHLQKKLAAAEATVFDSRETF